MRLTLRNVWTFGSRGYLGPGYTWDQGIPGSGHTKDPSTRKTRVLLGARLALGDKIRYRSFAEHCEIKLSYYWGLGYTQAALLNYPAGPHAGQRGDVRSCENAFCLWKF